jgi:hypothetical protein
VFENGNRQDGTYVQKAPVEGEEEEGGPLAPQWVGGAVASASTETFVM